MPDHYCLLKHAVMAIIMLMIGLAILVQIIRIQSSPEVAGVTGQGSYIWKTFYPARGEIYDRYGHLLAGNKTVYEVGVDLTNEPDVKDIALAAQMVLGMDPAEALTRMTADLAMMKGVSGEQMGPQFVAPAVVFLASPLAAEITGQVVGVEGGRIFLYRMDTTPGASRDAPWTPEEIGKAWKEIAG